MKFLKGKCLVSFGLSGPDVQEIPLFFYFGQQEQVVIQYSDADVTSGLSIGNDGLLISMTNTEEQTAIIALKDEYCPTRRWYPSSLTFVDSSPFTAGRIKLRVAGSYDKAHLEFTGDQLSLNDVKALGPIESKVLGIEFTFTAGEVIHLLPGWISAIHSYFTMGDSEYHIYHFVLDYKCEPVLGKYAEDFEEWYLLPSGEIKQKLLSNQTFIPHDGGVYETIYYPAELPLCGLYYFMLRPRITGVPCWEAKYMAPAESTCMLTIQLLRPDGTPDVGQVVTVEVISPHVPTGASLMSLKSHRVWRSGIDGRVLIPLAIGTHVRVAGPGFAKIFTVPNKSTLTTEEMLNL